MSFKRIGKFLSSERKKQGKTLYQISQKTRVSLLRLQEIEKGHHDPKLAKIYIQSYVKSYAKCLNIDSRQLIQLLDHVDSEERNLKLTEPQKIGKVFNSFLNITNISMMFAIGVFIGLITWTRLVIEKYNIQITEESIQGIQRSLSQIPLEQMEIFDNNTLPSYLKNTCNSQVQRSGEK